MQRKLSKYAAALTLLILPFSIHAQDLKTSFFLEDYVFGYRLNPAIQQHSSSNFTGLLLDNFNLSANTNVGIANYLFPYNGELVTGLNSHIPAEKFLGGLPSSINATFRLDNNLLSAGKRLKDGKSMLMFEVNMKCNFTMSVPKSLFEYLKSGDEDQQYRLSNAFMNTKDYVELSAAYSRQISDKLTVGAAVKGLLGLMEADATVKEMTITSAAGEVTIIGDGDMNIAMPTITLVTDNGHYDYQFNKNIIRFSGYGAAFDFGMTYKPVDALMVSAAVTDLGGLLWKNSQYGTMGGFRVSSGEEVIKSLKEVCQYNAAPLQEETSFRMIDGSVHLGARMNIASVDGLTAGATASYRFGDTKIADFRLGASYKRWDFFSVAATAGVTSFGPVLGSMVNMNFKNTSLFFGTDGFIFEFTPQLLPVRKVNTSMKFGLTFRH